MGFVEVMRNLKKNEQTAVPSDGTLTTDKTLLSLRRQKRLMDERIEKERLKAELRRRAMADDKKAFNSSKMSEKKNILSKLPKDKSKRFMSAKNNIFS